MSPSLRKACFNMKRLESTRTIDNCMKLLYMTKIFDEFLDFK